MLDDRIHRFYKKYEDRTIKVRSPKGCYRGMFKHLFESAFTEKEIRLALRNGWITKKAITMDGSHRVVYLWMGQKLLSPGPLGYCQLVWRKVVKFFKDMW